MSTQSTQTDATIGALTRQRWATLDRIKPLQTAIVAGSYDITQTTHRVHKLVEEDITKYKQDGLSPSTVEKICTLGKQATTLLVQAEELATQATVLNDLDTQLEMCRLQETEKTTA